MTGANSKTAYRKCVEAGCDASLETILNIYRNETATQHNFHSIQTPRWKAANSEDSIRGTSGGIGIFTDFHSFYDTFKILRSFRQESWNFEAFVVGIKLLIEECQIQDAEDKELITRNFLVTGANSKTAYRKCVKAGRDTSLETILNIYRNETSRHGVNGNNPVIQENGARNPMDTLSQQGYNGNARPMDQNRFNTVNRNKPVIQENGA